MLNKSKARSRVMDRYMIKIDEELKKSFINVQKSVYRMCSHNLDLGYSVETAIDESFKEIISNMDGLSDALNDIFSNGIKDMVDYDSVSVMGVKLSDAVDDYTDQPHQLSNVDFSLVFFREFIKSHFFKDLISVAYKVTPKTSYKTYEDDPMESGFSNVEELEETIGKCINDDMISCEKYADWTHKKKSQYLMAWQILFFLCACFIQMHIQLNISLPVKSDKVVTVRKQPQPDTDVVCLMKENTEAIIIEDTIRYYKIAFIDEKGIKREGYVSKKSVNLLYKDTKG